MSAGSGVLGGQPARLTLALLVLCSASCASTPAGPRGDSYIAVLARLPDVNGHYVDVASWQGRVLLVQFLASYCFPCFATAPRLQDLAQRYGKRGLSVVAVGMDLEGAQALGPFQEQLGLSFPVLVSDSSLREGRSAFGRVTTIPTTVIIGRDGTVLSAFRGVPIEESLETFIENALAMKP